MRLSFISALALISALMPFQGSSENIGGVSSRSSLDTPSLFAVRKNPPSPTSTAVFGIPRGGAVATTVSAKAPKTSKAPTPYESVSNFLSGLFSKEKNGWTISLVINLAYLYFFFTRRNAADPPTCDFAEGGFCVTNFDREGGGCPKLWNSHTWAFLVDMYFTYLGLKAPTNREPLARYGLVFTIFSHGLLHGVLGLLVNCGTLPLPGGEQIFALFGGLISYFILETMVKNYVIIKLSLAVVSGWLTIKLAGPGGRDGVSSIFLITQLLASLAATLFPGVAIKDMAKLGNSFVPPCLISLIELLYCCEGDAASLFNMLGGHVWYDIFLHRSVLIAISDGVEA